MATYRYDTLATQTINWTGASGKSIALAISLQQEMWDLSGQGEYTPKSLEMLMTATIDGTVKLQNLWLSKTPEHGYPATLAGKIGVSPDLLAQIEAAISAIHTHPAWIAKETAIANADKIRGEMSASAKRLDRMMTLNGHSY
jgi:hypothetical protein